MQSNFQCFLTVKLNSEIDIVIARQRTRQIAALLQYNHLEQVRFATAVSEIARNAVKYGGGGKIEFLIRSTKFAAFQIRIIDKGPGIKNLELILKQRVLSGQGMGLGIIGARRLVDEFEIQSSSDKGTTVTISKNLPSKFHTISTNIFKHLADELTKQTIHDPMEELRQQNLDLIQAFSALKERQDELAQLNKELEETNRGVVALYAELDDKAVSLQKINETKTRFFSNMTHEFRTPLNSILSLVKLLQDRVDGDLTREQEKQLHYIQKSAETLYNMVNDLLDIAKVEAGKTEVKPEIFTVSDLFATLRGMFRPLVPKDSPVELIFDTPKDSLQLYTDEGKVAQILRNFISNALKFTEKGEIRVTAKTILNTHIAFSVIDTGPGIAIEDQERIFEEFIQLETRPRKNQTLKGSGLGLPLTRKLASLLGGKVILQSMLGKGSTFSVIIPLQYNSEINKRVEKDIPNHQTITRQVCKALQQAGQKK